MPQMSPMNWLILFFMFLITFFLFCVMNYYTFIPSSKKSSYKKIKSISMNWKW